MTDRPMIFSAPMIQALLAGRKTQTRRIFTPPAPFAAEDDITVELATGSIKPRYAIGDRLWAREAWAHDGPDLETVRSRLEDALGGIGYGPYYRATEGSPDTLSWRSPIHMPRWASRLTLLVTDVRVERLNDISHADAESEGVEHESADPPFYYVPGIYPHSLTAVGVEELGGRHAARSFAKLWQHIHGPAAWDANPWVAAISFRVHRANIDALPADAFDIARAA